MNKAKMYVRDTFNKVRYLFRPATVIVTCLGLAVAADLIGILLICFVFKEGVAYDVILALITGVTASVVVSVIIEMANNYQRNNKRWLFLAPLYSSLLHYSSELAISTGHFDHNKAYIDFITRIHKTMVAQGEENEEEAAAAVEEAASAFADDEEENEKDWILAHDRIRCVFSRLPDIIPKIEKSYINHADVLSRKELDSLDTILTEYHRIEDIVKSCVQEKSTILFNKDPKDPGELVTWLPQRVKKDLGQSVLLALALEERDSEEKRIAETLMKHGDGGLATVGIELSEALIEGEPDNAPSDGTLNHTLSYAVSTMVSKIDHELLNLQKMIELEPGFGSFYAFLKEKEAPYLR